MGERTGIAWTDSTINVWHGCHKVSQGCAHCYAEQSTPVRVKRAAGLEVWGKDAARDETGAWLSNIRKWGRASVRRANFTPWRVFGQSLSDTFEDRPDLDLLRAQFFAAMTEWHSRSLIFQLLTKRPENIPRMVPAAWLESWPAHVQIGCTAEDQENFDKRIRHLLAVPAPVRFLSIEPQIGPVEATVAFGQYVDAFGNWRAGTGVSWVICGGESGSKARPFDLAWARSLRDQCRAAGVPFFLKQLGANPHQNTWSANEHGTIERLTDSHGADEAEWPADLRGCRAFPGSP